MRNIYLALVMLAMVTAMSSCDKDFEKVNVNPVLPTSLDPGYLFSNAQFTSAVFTLHYEAEITQQIATHNTGVLEGGNHNVLNDVNSAASFNSLYTNPVKFLADVINQTRENEQRSNLYHMARIWRAYVFHVLVDTYGDIPYFEAGQAYLQGFNLPKYDAQEDIYNDLLKELDEATKSLDASKPIEAADLFYKGNIDQWKRLGNSLLLRVAMRLSKADVEKAKQYVAIAVSGGVMQSVADNAFIAFNATFNNQNAGFFQGTERANNYLGKPFVDHLKETDDPRLQRIAVRYEKPANPLADAGAANTNPQDQIGMPYGYDLATISSAPGYPGNEGAALKYSQINRQTLGKVDAPEFFVTHAQTQLLLAEAAQRGWIQGNAADFYNAGVRAHMDQMMQYDKTAAIPINEQDTYLAANPFNPATALEQINTQYWIASFLNGFEAWSNFRRSGFPELTPNPYPGADPSVKGGFIRRLVYPVRERSVNTEHYNEAVARMGADNLATRVFWDK